MDFILLRRRDDDAAHLAAARAMIHSAWRRERHVGRFLNQMLQREKIRRPDSSELESMIDQIIDELKDLLEMLQVDRRWSQFKSFQEDLTSLLSDLTLGRSGRWEEVLWYHWRAYRFVDDFHDLNHEFGIEPMDPVHHQSHQAQNLLLKFIFLEHATWYED